MTPDTDDLALELAAATRGEYDVYGLLGRGGMASVYLATDVALARSVALKVIAVDPAEQDLEAKRFKYEAMILAKLHHPNIVPIYAIRQSGRLVYFVMRFVDGRGLDGIITDAGALRVDVARTILRQVAGALHHSHELQVVHRDVKPANIMIGRDGDANVTDFGIAHLGTGLKLTMTGTTLGTPYYMSPEQFTGEPVSQASDQYSLGVVAYEMLTGRPPFDGSSVMELMKGHVADEPVPLAELRDGLPPGLCAAVHRALRKAPADRWPTTAAFADAMDADAMYDRDAVRNEMVALASSGPIRQMPAQPIGTPVPGARARAARSPTPMRANAPARRAAILDRGRRWVAGVNTTQVLRASTFALLLFAGVSVGTRYMGGANPREVVALPDRTHLARGDSVPGGRQSVVDSVRMAAAAPMPAIAMNAPAKKAMAKVTLPDESEFGGGSPSPVGPTSKRPKVTAACAVPPAFSSAALKSRHAALLRICVTVDSATLSLNDQRPGNFRADMMEFEIPAGVIKYAVARKGCRTRLGIVPLAEGTFRAVMPADANPTCDR